MIQLNSGYFQPQDLPNLSDAMKAIGHDPRESHVFLDDRMIALLLNELFRRQTAALASAKDLPAGSWFYGGTP